MPLMIKFEKGVWKPIIICDHCGKEIADAKEGNYQWSLSKSAILDKSAIFNGEELPVFFTHKKCCDAFESQNSEHSWYFGELEELPVFMINNLNINWKAANKRIAYMASLFS